MTFIGQPTPSHYATIKESFFHENTFRTQHYEKSNQPLHTLKHLEIFSFIFPKGRNLIQDNPGNQMNPLVLAFYLREITKQNEQKTTL